MKTSMQSKVENAFKLSLDILWFLIQAAYLILKSIYELVLPSTYQHRKQIKGEIVLVTGGGGGLGRLLSLRLAKLGATVVLWDVDDKALEETVNLVKGIGGVAYAYKCDLADKDNVYKVAKKTQEDIGNVTILINNAGVFSGYSLLETPDNLIKRTFDVNSIAHFWTVKAFLPKMIENNKGHIVSIASMAGYVGTPKLVDYCASKYAVVGFDEALRAELDWMGINYIKTTIICPFFIQQTGMFNNVVARYIPTLKPNDVADRVIKAILREEEQVTIPGHIGYLLWLKMMVPQSVNSLMIRLLVPDASPDKPTNNPVKNNRIAKDIPSKKDETLINSVTNLNHRIAATGKNL